MFWASLICKTRARASGKYKDEQTVLPHIYNLVRYTDNGVVGLCHVLDGCASGFFIYFDKENYFKEYILLVLPLEVCFACVII